MRNSNHRPLSDWERERWNEIVHTCTSRPGGVEFGPQAKAIILGVARQLESAESALAEARAALEKIVNYGTITEQRMDRIAESDYDKLRSIRKLARAALANTETAGKRWEAMSELVIAVQTMLDNPPDTDNECGEWALSRVDLWQKVVDKAEALAELEVVK